MPTRRATVPAFAKINLTLLVLGKRGDGYHELRTVFQTISLADQISLEWTPGARWEVEATPEIPNNLAVRAAESLRAETGLTGRLRIDIQKHIQMGGGLGGGSSNAAAIFLALPTLAGISVPRTTLLSLATAIGSDVPFFLEGGTAFGIGRGEELYPIPTPKQRLALVVTPGVSVSTPEAYSTLKRQDLSALTFTQLSNKIKTLRAFFTGPGVSSEQDWRVVAENDFESVVFARHPGLGRIRERLGRLGANPARMSGSGSTLFGVFADEGERRRAVEQMPEAIPVRLMSARQYRAAWLKALSEHKAGIEWPPQTRYRQWRGK